MRLRERRRCSRARYWIGSSVVFALLGTPVLTQAQQPLRDPVGAEELFRQGVTAKNHGDWRTACDKFKKSLDLDPAVSTLYKVASCDEHDGKLATAWYGYQSALKMNRETRSDKRRRELDVSIRAALGQLEPRVPRLRITVTPTAEGLQLMRDGDLLVPASVLGEALPVDPGEHTVAARAPGYGEQRVRVVVSEGHTSDAALTLTAAPSSPMALALPTQVPPAATAPAAAGPNASSGVAPQTGPLASHQPKNDKTAFTASAAPGPHAPAAADGAARSRWTRVQTAYVVGAAGIVSLLAAGYFGLRTLDYVGDMNDHRRLDGSYDKGVYGPRAKAIDSQTIGLVLAGAGAALGALGVGLYVTAPRSKGHEAHAWLTNADSALCGVTVSGGW